MAYTTVFNDIVFVEGNNENVKIVGKVEYTYGSVGAHFKNLSDVKNFLSQQAKSKGCNCIVDFKYGQKASWLSLDDTKMWGKGDCGIMQEEEYSKIIKEKNS